MQVNIHYAKTHLSKLLEKVERGEEVVIARDGKPVAKLSPMAPMTRKQAMGLYKDKFEVPEDFNEPVPEIIELFEK